MKNKINDQIVKLTRFWVKKWDIGWPNDLPNVIQQVARKVKNTALFTETWHLCSYVEIHPTVTEKLYCYIVGTIREERLYQF